MRHFLFLLSFLVFSGIYAQKSNISEVLVYLQGAEITREAKINLTAGLNNIELKGLSGNIDPNSVQISGLGDAKISYVNLDRDYLSEVEIPASIKPLLDELDEDEFKLEIRRKVLNAYQEERSLLLANKNMLGNQSNLKVPDLVEMANLYRSRLKEIELKNLEISREIKDLQERIQKLRNQLGSWQKLPNSSQNSLAIGLSSSSATSKTITIKYFVYSAGWKPTYDIIASEGSDKIKLVYKATVNQSTGINWDNVSLSFSTGAPMQAGSLPQLYPEYVQILDKNNVNIRGARSFAKAETMEMEEVVMEDMEANYNLAEMSTGNVNTYFKSNAKHSITSYGKPVSVAINEVSLDAKYEYLAIPKVSQEAFLSAKVTGYEAAGLLPGSANMYYQDALTGSSYIDPNSNDEFLQLSLGKDPQISVERKAIKDLSKDGNLISSNKKSYHFSIQVKNNKSRKVNLLLKDQIPVSRNAEVQVVLESSDGAKLDPETGALSWNLDLAPGELKKLTFKYYIKFPKGEKINR